MIDNKTPEELFEDLLFASKEKGSVRVLFRQRTRIKDFISTHYISKVKVEEEIDKFKFHCRCIENVKALQDLKEKLLNA